MRTNNLGKQKFIPFVLIILTASLLLNAVLLKNASEKVNKAIVSEESTFKYVTTTQMFKALNSKGEVKTVSTEKPKVEEKVEKELYKVTASGLNIREGAGTTYKKVGMYYKDTVVEVIEKQGNWYKTKDGYICADYLSKYTGPVKTTNTAKVAAKSTIKPRVVVSRGAMAVHEGGSILSSSNLTLDEINKILEGDALDGLEQAVLDVEIKYGVNAYFTSAVLKLESAYGTSYIAQNYNNLFGMMGSNGALRFKSKEACINKFGELIQENYANKGLDTIKEINPKYCPPNKKWSSHISSIIREDMAKLKR